MSKCPYTWVKSLFAGKKSQEDGQANNLRVTVTRTTQGKTETTVDVALPAKSAHWLIDLIPSDVLEKIKREGIPIEAMNQDLRQREFLGPQALFTLVEPERSVRVWLE